MEKERTAHILYTENRREYEAVKETARRFTAQYGSGLIRDGLFGAMENCAARNGKRLELLRYPIRDLRLCSFTAVKDGIIFCIVNTCLPLGEQLFAAGRELYGICRYIERESRALVEKGSVFWDGGEEKGMEALRANAFSACVLVPEAELYGELERWGIRPRAIGARETVRLMESFGASYRLMVRRLHECGLISESGAEVLFGRENEALQYSRDSGLAQRWLSDTRECVRLGTLAERVKEEERAGVMGRVGEILRGEVTAVRYDGEK